MTNIESGRYMAQKFSNYAEKLLQAIYDGTVEPNQRINDFELGVIYEIKSWEHKGINTQRILDMIVLNWKL